ncbi:MAG TPA: VWA domain-containing protein [Candidatus Limnocylindrales bacterium]|nr:VWA domain-containing protein [Candidatus Limnocylindrales bacterium]
MLHFQYPIAFLLLLPLILLKGFSRRQVPPHLSVSMPPQVRQQAREVARPGWIKNLPSYCLYAFLFILIFLMGEPFLGKKETYEVKEARSILILLDTSASMTQTRLLEMVVRDALVDFIYKRPKEDRMALVRFDSDASGGIFTRNHAGLIMEVTRPSVIQEFNLDSLDQTTSKEKGTQIGLGLFKALASFLEDEVETRMAIQQFDPVEQDKIYQELQNDLQRFLWHWRQKNNEEIYPLKIPLVSRLEEVGSGKALIVVTDGQLLDPTSPAERVDYLKILDYYERLGFHHVYFVSLKNRPYQLDAHLNKNPSWKAYTWDSTATGLQDMFQKIAKDIDGMEQSQSVVATRIKEQPLFQVFLPSLLLPGLALGLRFQKRFKHFP